METERKDFRMSGLEERERAVELYFTTPMTTAQVVEHLGYPTRQCLERWLAMDSRYAGHMAKPIIPLETRRRAVELVLGGMQQKQAAKQLGAGVGAVHGWVRAYRKGGMAALQPKNRNSAQGNKPADSRRRPSAADDDDAEALRRRVEEPEPENALMREVVEARRKRPRRRPAAPVEQGEDPVDRPVEAGVFARLDDMPARHRAQRPPRPARRGQVRRTQGRGGRGVRRFQGQVRVPQDQGGAQDRRIGEGGPQDHGGGRARGARAQATQVWFLRGRDDAGSRQSRRPGLHGRASEREVADGHQRDQGQGREGRAFRRRSTASMARSSHTPPASAPTRSWPTGCRRKRPRRCRGTRVPWCIPTVDATAGGPDGSGSWNASG